MSNSEIEINNVKVRYTDFVVIELTNGKKLVNDPRLNTLKSTEDIAGAIMYSHYTLVKPNGKKVVVSKEDVIKVRLVRSPREISEFGYEVDDIRRLVYKRFFKRDFFIPLIVFSGFGILLILCLLQEKL